MKPNLSKKLIVMVSLLAIVAASLALTQAAQANNPPVKIVVDADLGVDDAAAIAYLLSLPRRDVTLLGITNVAGNTTVENSANNALLLLDTAQRTDIPVVVGAGQPLVLPASRQGMFVHGPDGLWFTGFQFPHDLSGLSHDAPGFLCSQATTHPGATLLALGPLTNVANAIQQCPAEMGNYSQIIWSGGAKVVQGEGNTPVSVFNAWFDPDAAQVVLESGLTLTMVTTDAAREVTVNVNVTDRLARSPNPLGRLMAGPLSAYATAVNQFSDKTTITLWDQTATVLALHPEYIEDQQSGLVLTLTADGPARGQTIIGLTLPERIQMIAGDVELSALADQAFSDPNFDLNAAIGAILFRQPDNASVILGVDAGDVKNAWLRALTRR